jgi:HD superfamily phosphohydrolase
MSGTAAADDAPPRRRVVRDPVHDYVEVPGELEALRASPAVQRLRNISQNARANTRYPSLNGSRYEHALGTMHLAAAGWESAWRSCEDGRQSDFAREVITELRAAPEPDPCTAFWVNGDDVEDTPMWQDFPRVIGLAVAAVGLLHDVGHPPFSHTLERFYQERIGPVMGPDAARDQAEYAALTGQAQFHEWAGLRIFDKLPDACFRHLPRLLTRLILSDRSGDDWTDCLHSIIDGQFDVDRLDYLMRDSHRAGTELGSIDWRRLVDSLELHRVPDGWRIGLGARAISAFETMLVQRAQHYRWVIHHPAAVATDAALTRCAEGIFDLADSGPNAEGADGAALADLKSVLPDLNYVDSAVRHDAPPQVCRDDPDFLAWLRAARGPLTVLAGSEAGELRRRARRLLRLHDVCDGFAIEPVAAWRNYHEFLSRAEQNPDAVAALVEHAPPPRTPAFLVSAASRQAAVLMLTELPARLNGALDDLLGDDDEVGARQLEAWLSATIPHVDGLGEGFWLVQPVAFLAVRDEFATVWRDNEESPLSAVSPFPLALTAIEVMRPHCYGYFVPFTGTPLHPGTEGRGAVGDAFFQGLAAGPNATGETA